METTFNAWDVSRYGGPEVLKPISRQVPSPASRQVLVRIRASAVSRADGMMRAGQPKFARLFLGLARPRNGLVGTCFSGDVVAVGDKVSNFHVGDAVFGEAGLQFGANATHICVEETGSLLTKPESVSFEEAKALGAKVTASASARNAELIKSLGADHVVDYAAQDPLRGSSAYDVIFDTLGISSFRAAKPALTKGGRYVCPVLGLALLRDMLFTAVFGRKTAKFAAAGMSKPEVHRTELSEVLGLMVNNRFSPVMDRTYPLSDLVEAHRYVETGRKRGNVVVV